MYPPGRESGAGPGHAQDRRPTPGQAKTDARDAAIIAEDARTMPLHKVESSPGDRQTLRQRRAPGLIRRDSARHPALLHVHPRRAFEPAREQKLKRALFLSASRPCTHPPSLPTTTANGPKANGTTKPSSPSPAAARTFSSPCSETGPSTKTPNHKTCHQPLGENHRGTLQGRRWGVGCG